MQPSRAFLPCAAFIAMTFSALAAPDENLLGKKAGYPIGTPANWFYEEPCEWAPSVTSTRFYRTTP
jgi:hypothetical protein